MDGIKQVSSEERRNWNGLIQILEIEHLDKDKNVLWRDENLHNMLHSTGELFVLNALFLGGNQPNSYVPNNYYFGLDNRTTLAASDTMTTVQNNFEPSTFGYARQPVASSGQFTVTLVSGVHQASSPIVSFVASGGDWGPVSNLFMTDQANNFGSLIASVPLSQTITVNDGETVSMRMGLSLRDCPP